ncbi:MAG TPA: Spy/CpxP family protein refolding chaperone [Rhodocyclaceae bacterium]|nr:Spy/CpxP family protein refolding chaperone [Rhodocyclaceae bacterium]
MKLSFASTLLVAGVLAATPCLVNATDAAKPGTPERSGSFQRRARDPVAFATKRLDDLGKKLNIKPSQQLAWQTYSDAMIASARERRLHWEQMKLARRSRRGDLSTPERMVKVADRLRRASDRMSKLASETKAFYDQLGQEQKTIFDLYARAGWHGARLARGERR